VSSLGGDLYHERDLELSLKWLASADTQLALGLRGLGLGATGVRERWVCVLDAGLLRRVLGRVIAGVRCENLTRSGIGDSPVAAASRFGVAMVLEGIVLEARAVVESGFETSVSLGLEAELTAWSRLRAGAGSAPGRLAFGLGLGRVREDGGSTWPELDVAWQWHPRLGGSSFVSISAVF
jgi:hypothetical protein